jgi:hypothetical protein
MSRGRLQSLLWRFGLGSGHKEFADLHRDSNSSLQQLRDTAMSVVAFSFSIMLVLTNNTSSKISSGYNSTWGAGVAQAV